MESKPLIEWTGTTLRYIDQTRLPDEVTRIETADYEVIAESIRTLAIRGAPAIGIAAAYGVVLAALHPPAGTAPAEACRRAIAVLAETRPTAVNLFAALNRMRSCLGTAGASGTAALVPMLEAEAVSIHREDSEACERIARFGAPLIPAGSSVLTHCHTGALATGGNGTALNVILESFRQGKIRRVYVDETRPLLQGARLTAWELQQAGVDAVLMTDSTAGYLMKLGRINAVLVGADRIAANGDVANKIGTYALAALARIHAIPFYVVAPASTIDEQTASGADIPIEERTANEVTHVRGIRIAPAGVQTFAPAFDVTPHELVTAIVTDVGVVFPPYDESLKQVLGSSLPEARS